MPRSDHGHIVGDVNSAGGDGGVSISGGGNDDSGGVTVVVGGGGVNEVTLTSVSSSPSRAARPGSSANTPIIAAIARPSPLSALIILETMVSTT